ncbi:glutamate synthase-related protein [Streptomyces sp. NPDC050504]|uniref:glutamate synthase-related protein n=1 Tax=Streptomyces sp. NPDC050504 TaxID=3365618 RepID=UPI003787AC37
MTARTRTGASRSATGPPPAAAPPPAPAAPATTSRAEPYAPLPGLGADGFPEGQVRRRAREGTAAVFPPLDGYGTTLYGAGARGDADDVLDRARIVPPVFMPERLAKLIELGREPHYADVRLDTELGGLRAPLPLFVSAFGSTEAAGRELGEAVARQAARAGLPLVIGENVVPVNGYRAAAGALSPLLGRVGAYLEGAGDLAGDVGGAVGGDVGGVVVQQSTEDADREVWNLVYSDTATQPLLATGRLAFELKVGQGAKPGLGGMTVLDAHDGLRVAEQYRVEPLLGERGRVLRSGVPGTFTEEILRQQVRLMRNNFPRARVWVKLHPGRDVARAAAVAWEAGADAVLVDGAEGGTGWAPTAFLGHVGLPLVECLRAVGRTPHCLLATGRMWEGARIVKALALGARAAGLGRAALVAADEDRDRGLLRLVESIALELRLLVSALGKYAVGDLGHEDVLLPTSPWQPPVPLVPPEQPVPPG